jgi:hypothetical protein
VVVAVKYSVLFFRFIRLVANTSGSIKIGLGMIFGPERKQVIEDTEKCPMWGYKISAHEIVLE